MGNETGLNPNDQEAAMALLNEHPLLSHDPYAKRVVETGVADTGKPVDIGNFLAARKAFLEMEAAKQKDANAYDAAVINVINSVRPDLENKTWLN